VLLDVNATSFGTHAQYIQQLFMWICSVTMELEGGQRGFAPLDFGI